MLLKILMYILIHFNSNMVWLKALRKLEKKYNELYFNSNMVWLKGLNCSAYLFLVSYFNSNMVWLKANIDRDKEIVVPSFQFQYGLIKSLWRMDFWEQIQYFNSNMVWLKVEKVKVPEGAFDNFNSNMVWLKVVGTNVLVLNEMISIPIWFD